MAWSMIARGFWLRQLRQWSFSLGNANPKLRERQLIARTRRKTSVYTRACALTLTWKVLLLPVSFANAQKLLGDRSQASAILEACFRECASLKLPLPPVFESSLLEELSQFDDKDCSKRSSRVLLCRRFFKTEFYNIANTLDRKPWRPCYALLVSR